MDLNANLEQRQEQRLYITPQLQHAIKLLQMPILELVEQVKTELESNIFLEENSDGEDDSVLISDENNSNDGYQDDRETPIELDVEKRDVPSIKEDNDPDYENYENIFEDSSDSGFIKKSDNRSDSNTKQNYLESAFPMPVTIYDHLIDQLRFTNITDQQFRIGEMIISSLDTDGYFKSNLNEIAEFAGCTIEEVEKVLSIIQTFDPPGVAARDLKEALLQQIKQDPEAHPIAQPIIADYLELLHKKKFKEIASNLGISVDDIKETARYIQKLEPIPGRAFDINTVKYVVPDVIVDKIDGGFVISINDDFIPKVKVKEEYKEFLQKESMDSETRNKYDKNYSDAKLLITSMEKRRNTIIRAMEKIIEKQKDFFDHGPKHLKPLVLKDIASAINMHESTISRVTTDKYVQTPWGIFELKYFFSGGLLKNDGQEIPSRRVKNIIKEIIDKEDKDSPLSDQEIADILTNRGIRISRRTVVKYRKELGISPSYQRKAF